MILRKDLGKKIFHIIHSFPRVDLSATVHPITSTTLKIDLTITPNFEFNSNNRQSFSVGGDDGSGSSSMVAKGSEAFWILVEDVDGEKLLYAEYFILKEKYVQEDHNLYFTVDLTSPLPPQYFIRVVSDRWIG